MADHLAQAVAFAHVVTLELCSAAPTHAINTPVRDNLDRAILALSGLNRALQMKPEPLAEPDVPYAEATNCTFCVAAFTTHHTGKHKTRDHLIPKQVVGNTLGPLNIAPACCECNKIKGNLTPDMLREMAEQVEAQAARLRTIADRTDQLIAGRGLTMLKGKS